MTKLLFNIVNMYRKCGFDALTSALTVSVSLLAVPLSTPQTAASAVETEMELKEPLECSFFL